MHCTSAVSDIIRITLAGNMLQRCYFLSPWRKISRLIVTTASAEALISALKTTEDISISKLHKTQKWDQVEELLGTHIPNQSSRAQMVEMHCLPPNCCADAEDVTLSFSTGAAASALQRMFCNFCVRWSPACLELYHCCSRPHKTITMLRQFPAIHRGASIKSKSTISLRNIQRLL